MARILPGSMPREPRDTIADGLTLDGDAPAGSPTTLVVVHRDGLSTVPLYPGHPLTVGREPPSHIRPRSRRLSRTHARFELVDGVVFVEDLSSTNGTTIGDRPLKGREALARGAEVRLGSVCITVSQPAELRASFPPPQRVGGQPVVASEAMIRLFDTVDRVAASVLSVLICGETGTGKEVVAQQIHARSPRAKGPMRCINCGALPANLVESILFGHERGAFTGADQRRAGVFEEASGGTVLLDEIGELSPQAQAALLRVLETKRVQQVGAAQDVAVDVRVLAATHRDLEVMCSEGSFRRDLLYRLNPVTLEVPPLRDRVEEIAPLVEAFVATANAENGRSIQGVLPAAMDRMCSYAWPGNLRELRNVVERAVVVTRGHWIGVEDLPGPVSGLHGAERTPSMAPRLDALQRGLQALDLKARVAAFEDGLLLGALLATDQNQTRAAKLLQMSRRTLVYRLGTVGTDAEPVAVAEGGASYKQRVDDFERSLVEEALARAGGDVAAASRMLSVQKRTLVPRLERWGLGTTR
jgi:DNA-binding NtrC family response regulator